MRSRSYSPSPKVDYVPRSDLPATPARPNRRRDRLPSFKSSMDARAATDTHFATDSGDEPPPPDECEGKEEDEGVDEHHSKDTRLSIIVTPYSQRAQPQTSDEDFICDDEEAFPPDITEESEFKQSETDPEYEPSNDREQRTRLQRARNPRQT